MVSFALLFRPRFARRLNGYGHVDNVSALPTCPQPQQQTQKPINAGSRNKRSLAARIPGNHVKPPTDSAEEAYVKSGGVGLFRANGDDRQGNGPAVATRLAFPPSGPVTAKLCVLAI